MKIKKANSIKILKKKKKKKNRTHKKKVVVPVIFFDIKTFIEFSSQFIRKNEKYSINHIIEMFSFPSRKTIFVFQSFFSFNFDLCYEVLPITFGKLANFICVLYRSLMRSSLNYEMDFYYLYVSITGSRDELFGKIILLDSLRRSLKFVKLSGNIHSYMYVKSFSFCKNISNNLNLSIIINSSIEVMLFNYKDF